MTVNIIDNKKINLSNPAGDTLYLMRDMALKTNSSQLVLTPYQSGYKHGVADGKTIYGLGNFMTKEGFGNHTERFNQGYIDGWCSKNPGLGSDADQGTFECDSDTTAAKNSTAIPKTNSSQLEHLAHTAYDAGNYTGALLYGKQAFRLDSNSKNPIILTNLGMAENEISNYTGALFYLKKALAVDPHHAAAMFCIGSVLSYLGNSSLAQIYFKKGLSLPLLPSPSQHKFELIERADAFIHLGNYSQANTTIKQVLRVDPTDEYALQTAGIIMLYQHPQNATGALLLFNKVLAQTTHHNLVSALDNKGLALSLLENYTGAVSILNTALTLDPRDEYAFYNKALVLIEFGLRTHNLGDMSAALENLDMALHINPDDKDALYVKELLTQLLRHNQK
jgi:tetratricopeptide (TPR) repeat protein